MKQKREEEEICEFGIGSDCVDYLSWLLSTLGKEHTREIAKNITPNEQKK